MMAALTVLSLVVQGWDPTPDEEVRFWSLVYGVDPAVALAVQEVESGRAPEHRRDLVVSQGNYGRFQVRCTTWGPYFGLRDCSELLDRHRNIRIGLRILRKFHDRFASRDGHRCRCPNGAGHHWTAHYNEGAIVVPGGRGETYGQLVASRVRRMERLARAQASPRGTRPLSGAPPTGAPTPREAVIPAHGWTRAPLLASRLLHELRRLLHRGAVAPGHSALSIRTPGTTPQAR